MMWRNIHIEVVLLLLCSIVYHIYGRTLLAVVRCCCVCYVSAECLLLCALCECWTPQIAHTTALHNSEQCSPTYEGWNFNFGNAAVTFDTAHLQSSYFHRLSMYSPKLCRTCSQWWGSRMMPLAAPVLLMVRTERSTAEGLNPPCNCPIQ